MTDQEQDELQALDRRISESLMGWRWLCPSSAPGNGSTLVPPGKVDGLLAIGWRDSTGEELGRWPKYVLYYAGWASDPAASALLKKRLRELGIWFSIHSVTDYPEEGPFENWSVGPAVSAIEKHFCDGGPELPSVSCRTQEEAVARFAIALVDAGVLLGKVRA